MTFTRPVKTPPPLGCLKSPSLSVSLDVNRAPPKALPHFWLEFIRLVPRHISACILKGVDGGLLHIHAWDITKRRDSKVIIGGGWGVGGFDVGKEID